MESIGLLQLHEMLPLIGEGNIYTHAPGTPEALAIRVGSLRMRTFKEKGTDCVVCGCRGAVFSIERHTKLIKATGQRRGMGHWHINLYGRNSAGKILLMTHDHIWPRSQGGYDIMQNSTTMCEKCNNRKADKLPTAEFVAVHGCAYDPHFTRHDGNIQRAPIIQTKKIRTPEEEATKAARRLAWQMNPIYNGRGIPA